MSKYKCPKCGHVLRKKEFFKALHGTELTCPQCEYYDAAWRWERMRTLPERIKDKLHLHLSAIPEDWHKAWGETWQDFCHFGFRGMAWGFGFVCGVSMFCCLVYLVGLFFE